MNLDKLNPSSLQFLILAAFIGSLAEFVLMVPVERVVNERMDIHFSNFLGLSVGKVDL